MKIVIFILLISLLVALRVDSEIVAPSGLSESDIVVSLKESNYTQFINSQDYSLVLFYAPWCRYCQILHPEYEKVAQRLKESDIKIGRVDCTSPDSKSICDNYGISAFPTIKYINKDGIWEDYAGPRKSDDILHYIIQAKTLPYTILYSLDELESFISDTKLQPLRLVLYTHDEGSPLARRFKGLSQFLQKQAGIAIYTLNQSEESIILYRPFDESGVKYNSDITVAGSLELFLYTHSLPLIGEANSYNYDLYIERNLPIVWIFIDYNDKYQVNIIEQLKPIAKATKDKLVFAKLDGNKGGPDTLTVVLPSLLPGIVIEDRNNGRKYIYPEKYLTVEHFKSFIDHFLQGKLQHYLRSEDIPIDNNKNVITIVGKQFNELVINNTNNVLILFYTPWCQRCKNIQHIYKVIGDTYSNDYTMVIGTMDTSKNDIIHDYDNIILNPYPSIYLYPSDNKDKPIRFMGHPNFEAIYQFIEQNKQKLQPGSKDEL